MPRMASLAETSMKRRGERDGTSKTPKSSAQVLMVMKFIFIIIIYFSGYNISWSSTTRNKENVKDNGNRTLGHSWLEICEWQTIEAKLCLVTWPHIKNTIATASCLCEGNGPCTFRQQSIRSVYFTISCEVNNFSISNKQCPVTVYPSDYLNHVTWLLCMWNI